MSDLLTEIQDSFREQRLQEFWKKYGNFIIGVVLVCILGTAVVSAYRAWDDSVRRADTTALLDLLDSPDFPKNIETAELDMRADLRAIALLNAGGTLLKQGNSASALSLYTRAADDSAISGDFRQLARLMQVRLSLQDDKTDASAMRDHLAAIANDSASPWQHHAKLDLASLLATREQRFGEAQELLNDVMETQGLPDTIYSRARDLQHAYGLLKPASAPDTETEKTDHES